jgi:hypothetical protein
LELLMLVAAAAALEIILAEVLAVAQEQEGEQE